MKVHWPYVLAEAFFVTYQLAWSALFLANGFLIAAIGTTYIGACVAYLAYFYGDHAGKVCFVIDRAGRRRARSAPRPRRADTTEPVATA